jgi:hypothetical protein
MIFTKCNQLASEDSRFCERCGAPLTPQGTGNEAVYPLTNSQVSPGILMGGDGILRWVYELNMWKNPTLVITIWKVLLLAALVPAILVFFLSLGDGFGAAMLTFLKIMGIVAGIVTVLMLFAYPFVAMLNGGKYCVLFEMDDNSVKHTQMQKQFQKSQLLSMIVILAGVMAGNVQATAAGVLAGSKQSSISSFEKVKTITVNEKRHVIYLNENSSHNQVYAEPADFSFVLSHILRCCKKAKVIY